MNTLQQLQHDFQACVYRRDEQFSEHIVSTENADASRRLSIYQQAYRLRLLEVLELDYPGLQGLTGKGKFSELAEEYIEAHTSNSRSVRHYGAQMATFLRRSQTGQLDQIWAEMAEFEWLKGEAFDAADAPHASIEDLAAIPASDWPPMCFRFHPSLRTIGLGSNIPALWRAIADDQTIPETAHIHPRQRWLIWRYDLMVRWRPLEHDEAAILQALMKGANFADVCGILDRELEDESASALRAVSLLKRWFEERIIRTLEV